MNEKSDCCVYCGEQFSDKNVLTKEGWAETKISQVCEKCFDKLTKEPDEYDESDLE